MRRTGTSVAAAHGAGVAALLLEWARENVAGAITGKQVSAYMIRGAERMEDLQYPNRLWGDLESSMYMIYLQC